MHGVSNDSHRSERIPEPRDTLNHNLARRLLAVLYPHVCLRNATAHKCHCCRRETCIKSRAIRRRILCAKHHGAQNTANTTCSHHCRRGEGALPLASDVIGLVRHRGANIGVASGSDEEGAEIPDIGLCRVTEDSDADDFEDRVDEDEGAANLKLIREVGFEETEQEGESIAL